MRKISAHRRVISPMELPTRLPVAETLAGFLILERFGAPRWFVVLAAIVASIVWIVLCVAKLEERWTTPIERLDELDAEVADHTLALRGELGSPLAPIAAPMPTLDEARSNYFRSSDALAPLRAIREG